MPDSPAQLPQRRHLQGDAFYGINGQQPQGGVGQGLRMLMEELLNAVKPLPSEPQDVNLPNQGGGIDPRILEKLFGSSYKYQRGGDFRHIDTPEGLEFTRNMQPGDPGWDVVFPPPQKRKLAK